MNDPSDVLDAEKRTVNQPRKRAAPNVIDGGTGQIVPAQPKEQRTPLATLEHVKRELGRLYRSVKAGKLPSDEGSKRAYILTQTAKVIEQADLERRHNEIEQRMKKLMVMLPGAVKQLPAPDGRGDDE